MIVTIRKVSEPFRIGVSATEMVNLTVDAGGVKTVEITVPNGSSAAAIRLEIARYIKRYRMHQNHALSGTQLNIPNTEIDQVEV